MNKLWNRQYKSGKFEVYSDRPNLELVQVTQKHTNKVVEFKGSDLSSVEADGIISTREALKNISLAIKTADCLPILFVGEKIALVHAGWRGLADNILSAPLLREEKWKRILIGPSIRHYEVQADFKKFFPNSNGFYSRGERLYFNLQLEALSQLESFYPEVDLEDSLVCTFENSDFNSYRRDKTELRNWNIFTLNQG